MERVRVLTHYGQHQQHHGVAEHARGQTGEEPGEALLLKRLTHRGSPSSSAISHIIDRVRVVASGRGRYRRRSVAGAGPATATKPGSGGSIGESWGDYFAVTVGLAAANQYGWPVMAEEACPMDWDATSYTSAPHCIRRFDLNLTVEQRRGEVHYDGQIWSQALWEIRKGYEALGLGTQAWDTTLIDSQFDYAPDTSFSAAAKATYDKALARDGRAAADLIRTRFAARHITF